MGKEDAEIGYLQQGVLGDQDILGLDIAMDNAALVGKFHAVTELNGKREGGAEISATTGLDPFGKIPPIDKFNKEMGDFVDGQNIKTGGNIGMHAHSDPAVGFFKYPAHAFTVRKYFRPGRFDGNLYFPAEMLGDVNIPHGPRHNLFNMVPVKDGVARGPDGHLRIFSRFWRGRFLGGWFPGNAWGSAFFPPVYVIKESRKHPGD